MMSTGEDETQSQSINHVILIAYYYNFIESWVSYVVKINLMRMCRASVVNRFYLSIPNSDLRYVIGLSV